MPPATVQRWHLARTLSAGFRIGCARLFRPNTACTRASSGTVRCTTMRRPSDAGAEQPNETMLVTS